MTIPQPAQNTLMGPRPRDDWSARMLDQLSYGAKLRHWLRPDAWNPDGARLKFANPTVARGAIKMRDGHIQATSPMIGRPCFGIATAFLRYRDHLRYVENRGVQKAGRCNDCNAREACHWVVHQRLRSTGKIMQAWTEWLQADGPSAFAAPYFDRSAAYRRWAALCRELQNHPFTSENDHHVIEHYSEKDRIERERDRDRQAANRRRARREGVVDDTDLAMLADAASRRWTGLVLATWHPQGPKAVSRLPDRSMRELIDVWLGREILRLKKEKPNAPNIARWIVSDNRNNDSANHDALATRVAKDLNRISKFERIQWGDGVLLPPLVASELTHASPVLPTAISP